MFGTTHRRELARTYDVTLPLALQVRLGNGRLRVTGEERDDVALRVRIDAAVADDAEMDKLVAAVDAGVKVSPGRIDIEAPQHGPRFGVFLHLGGPPHLDAFSGATAFDYELSVPRATELAATCHNGLIEARGIERAATLESHNGRLAVEDVGGPVKVRLHNGRVEVRACRSSLEVNAANGEVALGSVDGPVTVESHNGALRLEDLNASLKATTRNGPIEYSGPLRGDFELSTRNAPIRLRLPADSRFEIDAESELGAVTSEFSVRESAAESSGPRPKLRLRSTRGPILIGRV